MTRPAFTEKQLAVARLIAYGRTSAEIGDALGISTRAAKAHSDVLRSKCGVAKRRDIPAALDALGYDVYPRASVTLGLGGDG